MKKYLLFLPLAFWATAVFAQTPPAGLEGAAFRTWLRDSFYVGKHISLGYTLARKKMYAYTDNIAGKITCVYGGMQVNNPYGTETTAVSPINCEHTVPQSFFGSSEPMMSDIHHLFPTYENWNSARSNNPFVDIPDSLTQLWMTGTASMTTFPTTNIDAYSEYRQYLFEPREVQKGNTARAVAYFFTMYPAEAGTINRVMLPNLLCDWNDADPVDAQETLRNDKIFQYQHDKNPYVVHPEWLRRAWCPTVVATQNTTTIPGVYIYKLYPNPASENSELRIESERNMPATMSLTDITGRILETRNLDIETGRNTFTLKVANYQTGFYYLQLQLEGGVKTLPFVIVR